jgi:ankyrin repeat protein
MHPLSWNAYAGHVENIRLLLQHGAEVNADVDSMSSNGDNKKKITALDIVEQFLQVQEGADNAGGDDADPANERFVKTRELLLQHGAKRYADLTSSS